MPFEFKKFASHGTTNPIVARLSLQNLKILENCKGTKEFKDKVGGLYLESLMKKLLRCWEIEDAFKKSFAEAAGKYKPPQTPNAPVEIPQIERLDADCHNFLYEAKNYIRDVLYVINKLYGTSFTEASEFSKARKGGKSLIDIATETFGSDDARTKMFVASAPWVEHAIAMRNAVEHPDGYSGRLVIENIRRDPDQKLSEPIWYRIKDGKNATDPSSIRADFETLIHNLLTLGEDVLVSWANENLDSPEMVQIEIIPEERRDPQNPAKYTVGPGPRLREALTKLPVG
ncbi:hypothetical protein [Bradyrhizobium sp. AUGA SZCCT0182]|uniref:hypothetical protein n=1 Tax=Bradyrhizobium sp. AUGA SZCCT0182 TaxID=2807667 RepID=UPI001BA5FC1B|nr:hypothetical protein [Bradyrhizobium sp. AUGA SZCCT0182]MBR1234120.1 hypothetical protein [Bradyrhizobium sp. AUGA SZCCT0182]